MHCFCKWSCNEIEADRDKGVKALKKEFLAVRLHHFRSVLLFDDSEGCSYTSVTNNRAVGKENYVVFMSCELNIIRALQLTLKNPCGSLEYLGLSENCFICSSKMC